jgi:ketosteroid isomerase-like protein
MLLLLWSIFAMFAFSKSIFMKKIVFLPALFISVIAFAQSKDEISIRKILNDQTKAWNRGNVEEFMQGYWRNDSLMFIGSNGINWGWQKTLENYKRRYPDTAAMGQLSFDIILIKKLSPEFYYVVGKWMLNRSIGDLNGYYNLLFKKIKGQWLIIADHSS